MLLADMELAVRQDLNDTDATQYRWQTAVLDRCIARAVREYSFVWPRVQGMVLPCSRGVRAYALPVPSTLSIPSAPALSISPMGGNLPAGELFVRVTACTSNSETAPSAETGITLSSADHGVAVEIAPVSGARFYSVYVGTASGAEYWNGQTSVTGPDSYTIRDLAPAAPDAPESVLRLSGGLPLLLSEPTPSIAAWWAESVEFPIGSWPPHFVPFEEQGGLFILNVDDDHVPQQASDVLNLVYAGMHQLDAGGSSLPEQDWDVVALGAHGYACLQYGLPASDNFMFQDGEMRDHVDDSMVPKMWRQYGLDALAAFRSKLEEIRRRRDFAASAVAQWGDVPHRWDRL